MLNDDVTEAIKKNLPSAVADELKVFIEKAQKTERELAQATNEKTNANAQYRECSIQLSLAQRELDNFKLREKEFQNSEDKVRTFTLDRAIAQAKLEGAMEVTRLVFANTIIKRQVFEGGSTSVVGPGGYPQSAPTSNNKTETVEG